MEPREQVLNALQSSLEPDPQKLKNATTFLTEMRQHEGYCLVLMQIVDAQNLQISIKQAALVQLKNTVKVRWNPKSDALTSNDKNTIRGAIVTAIVRCSKDNRLVKLYREVLTIIIGHDYKEWLPLEQLIPKLRNGEDLSSVMHCLIAIAATFEYSIADEQRQYFFELLKKILPELTNTLQSHRNPQLIYLAIKFLWKGVHYDIDDVIKRLVINWMNMLKMIVGMENSTFDNNKKIIEFQVKNSEQFFYFHSKKWATRIILRFIQKHAKMHLSAKDKEKLKFSQEWYNSYGFDIIKIIYSQLKTPNTPKVRYFQLKCLYALASERPDAMQDIAQELQYSILIPYLTLKPEDQELANSDPIQFLNKEMQPCMNYTNLKRVATDIWTAIAQIGSKTEKDGKKYTPGGFFFKNMAYLQQKLQSNNQIEKQFAMYLICQLRSVVIRCADVKAIMPQLMANYVIPEFSNKITFLRARAVDIFYEYGSIGLPMEVLSKATEAIYICLTQDEHAIVRIKAATAFNCILRHKSAKELVRPLLKNILTVYLKLLEQYDIESLVSSLESIVQDFAEEIQPFAHDLIRYMLKLFTKLFSKDAEQSNNDDYNGQTELAAAGCLKTITQIIDAPLSNEVIHVIQEQVVSLCYFVFSQSGDDYIQDLLVLLNSYLYKANKLSPDLWFFYQVIIYNMTGIPKALWAQIESAPFSQRQKDVLASVKGGGNMQMMEQSMLVLRNYIRKGSQVLMNNADSFKTNLLQLLFLLVAETYKKGPGQYTGELQMTCCTTLLLNFAQNNKTMPEPVLLHIWQLAKYNICKLKSRSIKAINCQLLSLLIYNGGGVFISLVNNDKMLDTLLKQFIDHESKIEADYQYQRMILGLSTLITISERPQPLRAHFPALFKLLVNFLKKSINVRIKLAGYKQGEKTNNISDQADDKKNQDQYDNLSQDGNQLLESILNGEQDQDDDNSLWEELHDQNYLSLLNGVDQIKYFEESIRKIQRQEPHFYPNMMQLLPQEELATLQHNIQKAIEVFPKIANQK